ncbi:MAG: sigma-54-dependent Fis family transcriptional regulator [Nitrospirae bacterium]|nr:MAG: sigma-54-dependent Fis family transcriptional regulator [Nitrospirota bacterium]
MGRVHLEQLTHGIAKGHAPFTILIVEPNAGDTELLLHAIEEAELKAFDREIAIQVRATAEGALDFQREHPVDLVLTELNLPGLSGLTLVSQLHDLDGHLPILVVTHQRDVGTAVEAIRRGAYDYMVKPVSVVDLGAHLHRAIRYSEIMRGAPSLRSLSPSAEGEGLIGISEGFRNILRGIHEATQSRATVLITGETGTGKGLIARTIHEQSAERDKPYQVIDCTTVPEGTIESELFGHVKGAFTGALSDKPGLIELANGGSVFLDEIGDLPLHLQTKLLHVIEEKEVRPVGGIKAKRVDTRFICATNQDLEEKVKQGSFRKDLYYRLAVVVIRVPPLRDRAEDIPVIAKYMIQQFGKEMGKPLAYISPAGLSELVRYPWPGNVRELRNVLERAMLMNRNGPITEEDIRELLPASKAKEMGIVQPGNYAGFSYIEAKEKVLTDFIRSYLRSKLAMHNGNITKAAEDSGIPRQHFSLLMKQYLRQEHHS